MKHPDKQLAPLPSPWRVFLTVLAIIFLAEVAAKLLAGMLPLDTNTLAGELADDVMLVVFSAPFLWWVVVRPLRAFALTEHAIVRVPFANTLLRINGWMPSAPHNRNMRSIRLRQL
jgi:hypothetical protein